MIKRFFMSGLNYVTQETLEQMKEELNTMRTRGRAEIARAIADAREKGDLRENAEYDAAKEAQGHHEARIARLETTIASTRVVDIRTLDTTRVSILATVRILNISSQKSMTYRLVSEKEADLKAGKISVTSPIGKGLLGKRVGELAEVTTPNGVLVFRIEEISI